jgi:hypothetical protein
MKELSLHILDIVQNSLHADATEISVSVLEDLKNNLYSISIKDNGIGIPKERLENLLDPFYTTKNKKTGLGIPLLKQHAEMAGGNLSIESQEGVGTTLTATFGHNHLDRQPMGDIVATVTGIVRANPQIRITYMHQINEKKFIFDTSEIKAELENVPINSKEVLNFIDVYLRDNLNELST